METCHGVDVTLSTEKAREHQVSACPHLQPGARERGAGRVVGDAHSRPLTPSTWLSKGLSENREAQGCGCRLHSIPWERVLLRMVFVCWEDA